VSVSLLDTIRRKTIVKCARIYELEVLMIDKTRDEVVTDRDGSYECILDELLRVPHLSS
jgi:hypothetical protein